MNQQEFNDDKEKQKSLACISYGNCGHRVANNDQWNYAFVL